jgi:hypothetical protein
MADLANSSRSKRQDGRRFGAYVLGGIPAIVGFLALLFAIGVRYCGLPA